MNPKTRRAACLSTLLTLALSLLPLQAHAEENYTQIEWTDLIPEEDLEALLNPPEWINEIPEGSAQDQINNKVDKATGEHANSRYQQALESTDVRPEFDKRKIKIAGYIVPLIFNDEMVVTEFFLVPFFGACIHVPPPPPNQMIYIAHDKGLTLENLYDPYVVKGTLRAKSFDSGEMGNSAYSMDVGVIERYRE